MGLWFNEMNEMIQMINKIYRVLYSLLCSVLGYWSVRLCLAYYAYILIGVILYGFCIDYHTEKYCSFHLVHDAQSLNWGILLSLLSLSESIFKCFKERKVWHLIVGLCLVGLILYSGWWLSVHGFFSRKGRDIW